MVKLSASSSLRGPRRRVTSAKFSMGRGVYLFPVYKNGYKRCWMKTFTSVWDAIESGQAAESLKARARVMVEVQAAVSRWGLSQAAAAEKLGISQPRINDLLRGKSERFSLDALFDLATHAGVELHKAIDVREVSP